MSASQLPESERFAALDLLRGVAALSVLALHLDWPATLGKPLPRAYLAVDLFFVLSGFVIAHAYRFRLGTARQLRQFCLARVIRLYPLYLIATVIGGAEAIVFLLFGSGDFPTLTLDNVAASFATGILFLPTLPAVSLSPVLLFPLVLTAWSLFWEVLINLLYGVIYPRLRTLVLFALIGFGLCLLAVALFRYGSGNIGAKWEHAWAGAARATFSFFVGVALFRLRGRFRAPKIPAVLLAAVLLASFVPTQFGGWRYDLLCIVFLFPALVWFGADSAMGQRVGAIGSFAGYISYPVYLLQAPLLRGFRPVWLRVEKFVPIDDFAANAVEVAVVVLVSWLIATRVDSPVRELLRRKFLSAAPPQVPQSAP